MTDNPQAEDVARYLRAVYGEATGHAHLAVGTGQYITDRGKFEHRDWTETVFAWPAEAHLLVAEVGQAVAAGADVYVCPYLTHGRKRAQGAAVARRQVHADVDTALPADKVAALEGGFAVASGTGENGHAYVALSEPVPANIHRALCRALGQYLGAVDAKISDNDVLRPPGTLNHKPQTFGTAPDPAPVTWLVEPTGATVAPAKLAEALGMTLPTPGAPEAATGPAGAVEEVDVAALPQPVRDALAEVSGDRSVDTMRVVGACYDAGLTLAQTRGVVADRPDLRERLAERKDDDVLTCWLKATDERQRRAQAERQEDAWLRDLLPSQPEAAAAKASQGPRPVPRPAVWKATELEPARRVEWLANRRIVAGATNYMLGPEGIGKSLFLVWLTALVTTGRPFPEFGIPARAPRTVVLVLTEDDWSTIARPRLEVAGADLDFVRVICAEKDGSGAPTFPEDMTVVETAAADAAVVIVDAWADTLPGSLSVKDPQQARQALHPWKELATRTGVAVLLSGHTNREKGANVRNAYGLTGELRKKARMTILAQPDQDEDGVFTIGPEKSNVAAPVPASRFRIDPVQVFVPTEDSDGTVPRLVWVGDAEQSARDLYADAAAAEHGDDSEDRNEADKWLRAFLAGGVQKATEVYSAADANGFSKDQVKRAKRRIGAVADRPENPGPWYWSLPAQEDRAGSTEHPDPLSVLPALPVRSEGVRQGAGSREQGHAQDPPPARAGGCDRCGQGLPHGLLLLGRSRHTGTCPTQVAS
jgi:hypothetical protein